MTCSVPGTILSAWHILIYDARNNFVSKGIYLLSIYRWGVGSTQSLNNLPKINFIFLNGYTSASNEFFFSLP